MASFIGTEINDVLFGGFEDDFLDGGLGEDGLYGGFGNDTYVIGEPGDEVTEFPNQGIDKVTAAFEYTLPENVENLKITIGTTALGNRLPNLIEANDTDNIVSGFGRNDILYGFEGNDVLDGGEANDRLYGGGGNDLLIAGRGYDEMYGGPGNDTYVVRSYAFRIVERRGPSSDTIRIPLDYQLPFNGVENLALTGKARFGTGNTGNNTVSGNGRANVLSGLEGNDTLLGNGGNDSLFGNEGRDRLSGGKGADQLYGQDGTDKLFGNQGNDILYGENGRDILTGYGDGQRERDRLVGGEGNDVFVLGRQNTAEIYYRGSGYAIISDFERSERDKIQVAEKVRTYQLVKNRNYVGSSDRDTAIFRGRDLIAVIEDNTSITFRDLIAASL